MTPAEADAEVDQGEVDAEVLLARRARDDCGDQGVERRPGHPEVEADEEERQRHRRHGVVAKARTTQPTSWEAVASSSMTAGRRAGRSGTRRAR